MSEQLPHTEERHLNTHAGEIRTRFAPSPTGHLHLGHLYAARIAHDLARDLGGKYLLRFEDIDATRVRDEYYDSILDDLKFFDLKHDEEPTSQLEEERTQAYQDAMSTLNELGITYPCFCSRKEIARELALLTNAPHKEDSLAPHYPGTCKKLTPEQIQQHLSAGKPPAIRIDADKAKALTDPLTFTDLIHGEVQVDHHILGDCVLSRKFIGTSYHIASVVDDAQQEITHVSRGEDLLECTHLHRILQTLLKLAEPIYLHHALVVDKDEERLAKRADSLSIKELREEGYDSKSLTAMMLQQLNSDKNK